MPRRIGMRIVAAVLAVALLGACDRMGRRRVVGGYLLLTRNGQALPLTTRYSTFGEDCRIELLSGHLALRSDGSWLETLVNNEGCAAVGLPIRALPATHADSGAYVLDRNGTIEFRRRGAGADSALTGILAGDTLRVQYRPAAMSGDTLFIFVYARQH